MWGVWWQTELSWVWLLIEFSCKSMGFFFFHTVNKVPDSNWFLVSFTSGEALTIQFFGELCCCNGNLPKGKAQVRSIKTHRGDIQAWLVVKNICIIYASSNIYLFKMEQDSRKRWRKWVTWHFLNQMYTVKRDLLGKEEKKPNSDFVLR